MNINKKIHKLYGLNSICYFHEMYIIENMFCSTFNDSFNSSFNEYKYILYKRLFSTRYIDYTSRDIESSLLRLIIYKLKTDLYENENKKENKYSRNS